MWRNAAAWTKAADVAVALMAASLPWSTSLVSIFAVIWILLLIPTVELRDFTETLKRPAGVLPILFFALAVVGTLWATDTPWAARLQGINPVAKLIAIPILIRHFEKSGRGLLVFVAFLASCSLVMVVSWLTFADPRFVFDQTKVPGVPVKNYISQSQEFALCAFGAAGAALTVLRERRMALAAFLIFLAILFIANMVFVISSRTVLVCIPVLLAVLAVRHFGKGGALALLAVAAVLTAFAWNASSHLRDRINNVSLEYKAYKEQNQASSTGMRLEFWRKSIKFVEGAPLIGNGTGATKTLFERDAIGRTGVSSEIIGNPHNQTLNAAVQWGVLGCIVLYAMWLSHFALFRGAGLAAWIGLIAVVQNVVSSLFNSHIFDFVEGWIYVLAVGIAGGMVSRIGQGPSGIIASGNPGTPITTNTNRMPS
jgi:hypothetical protein